MLDLTEVVTGIVIGPDDLIKVITVLNEVANTYIEILIFGYSSFTEIDCELCLIVIPVRFVGLFVFYFNVGKNSNRR